MSSVECMYAAGDRFVVYVASGRHFLQSTAECDQFVTDGHFKNFERLKAYKQ